MATYSSDASQATVQPKAVHAAAMNVNGIFSLTATLVSGDVILGPKIPDEGIIDDVRVFVHPSAGVVSIAVGDGDNRSRFLSTVSVSGNNSVQRADENIGYQYLFSDNVDMDSLFDTVDIHVGPVSSGAGSGYVVIGVSYHMP